MHTCVRHLASVLHRQAVKGRNPEIGFNQHELPDGFKGSPSSFWKISRNAKQSRIKMHNNHSSFSYNPHLRNQNVNTRCNSPNLDSLLDLKNSRVLGPKSALALAFHSKIMLNSQLTLFWCTQTFFSNLKCIPSICPLKIITHMHFSDPN